MTEERLEELDERLVGDRSCFVAATGEDDRALVAVSRGGPRGEGGLPDPGLARQEHDRRAPGLAACQASCSTATSCFAPDERFVAWCQERRQHGRGREVFRRRRRGSRVVVLFADRAEAADTLRASQPLRPADADVLELEPRWQSILHSAAEDCERTISPPRATIGAELRGSPSVQVVTVSLECLARVHCDGQAERGQVGPVLATSFVRRSAAAATASVSRGEDREGAITFSACLEQRSTSGGDRLGDERVVPASTPAISVGNTSHKGVEPSMSVSRSVTTPVGRVAVMIVGARCATARDGS